MEKVSSESDDSSSGESNGSPPPGPSHKPDKKPRKKVKQEVATSRRVMGGNVCKRCGILVKGKYKIQQCMWVGICSIL